MQTVPTASTSSAPVLPCNMRLSHCTHSTSRAPFSSRFSGRSLVQSSRAVARIERASALRVCAIKDGAVLDRKLRVAVIGGGPSGACTAETLAQGGIETILIERKLDNCKVCAWALARRSPAWCWLRDGLQSVCCITRHVEAGSRPLAQVGKDSCLLRYFATEASWLDSSGRSL